MSTQKTTTVAEAIRNLIVCDTQFGWKGETTLKLPELLHLQARGWLVEGHENNEFDLTAEGRAVIARALQQAEGAHPLPPERKDEPMRGDEPMSEQQDAYMFNRGWNACRDAAARLATHPPIVPAPQQSGEVHPDDVAVEAFAAAMKAKMAAARAKGRGGWEDPAQCTAVDLTRMLRDHVEKGDPRDVANFCMMLWNRKEGIAATGKQQGGEVKAEGVNARAQFEAWAKSKGYGVVRLQLMCDPPKDGGYASAFTHDLWNAWQAALAARQTAGQEPVGVVYQGSSRFPQARLSKPVPVGTFLYAAPHAQAVDLGPVRAALQAAEALCACCASIDGYSRSELNAFGQNMRSQFRDALAVIDGKAVQP